MNYDHGLIPYPCCKVLSCWDVTLRAWPSRLSNSGETSVYLAFLLWNENNHETPDESACFTHVIGFRCRLRRMWMFAEEQKSLAEQWNMSRLWIPGLQTTGQPSEMDTNSGGSVQYDRWNENNINMNVEASQSTMMRWQSAFPAILPVAVVFACGQMTPWLCFFCNFHLSPSWSQAPARSLELPGRLSSVFSVWINE